MKVETTNERLRAQRERILSSVEKTAGSEFAMRAERFILRQLQSGVRLSAEEIVLTCREFGIIPPTDDRAFDPVFIRLAKAGKIEKCGAVPRTKGHGTSGGNLWKMVMA